MDYPYVVNFFTMLLLAYLYWKKPDSKYVKWAFALQFIFIAFRAPVVGADTWNYIRYLTGERSFYNADSRELESGFILYRNLLVQLHGSRFVYMLINSFLACYPLYLLIKRYSSNVPLTMAMLSIFNIYTTYFCALRQILGLAILFLCVLYVLDDRKYKWVVFLVGTALGYTFHTSIILYSLIFVAAYFLKIRKRMILILCILGSAVIGVVLQSFNVMQAFDWFLSLNFDATERIQGYMENEEVNEVTALFISLRPTMIAILIYSLMEKDKLDHWLANIYFMGVIIGNLFISVPMIHRITMGMMVFGPIVFTWIFSKKYYLNLRLRSMTNAVLVLFFLYFSQAYIKNNLNSNIDLLDSGRMHPYQFVWEDYNNHPSIIYF